MTYKKCTNCGSVRKTSKTYHCVHCGRLVCLDCYNFVKLLCASCEVMIYNEEYKPMIEDYAQERRVLS